MDGKEENQSDELNDNIDGNDPFKDSENENIRTLVAKSESDKSEETDQFLGSCCVAKEMLTTLAFVDCENDVELDIVTLTETSATMPKMNSPVAMNHLLTNAAFAEAPVSEGMVWEPPASCSNVDFTQENTKDFPEKSGADSGMRMLEKSSDLYVESSILEGNKCDKIQLSNCSSAIEPSTNNAKNVSPTVEYTDLRSSPRPDSLDTTNCSNNETWESCDAAEFIFSGNLLFKLPPEILLKIFSYLSLEDICLRIAPLCRYCYHLSRDPCLWRHVYISRSCSVESALMLLNQATLAEVLHIANHPHIESILLNSQSVSSCAKTLTCLDIGFSEISAPVLKSAFSTDLPGLVHLNLEGCRFLDTDALNVVIPRLPKRLKRISLSHCFRLSDDCLNYIFEYLPNLTHLNLDGVEWISDEGVKTIVDLLGPILQALWLDGENLTNTSCELVALCTRLKLLSIRYCEGFTNIRPLREMSSLRSLSIRKNSEIGRDQVKELFDLNESHLAELNYLDISECYAINDDIVGVICSLCGPNLFYLMLEWCWEVTDIGIQKIADSCPHLVRLCLNGMHNLIGQPFAAIPSVFPHLSVLNLTNCNSICDELIQKVVDQNPHLIVFTYYGERFETEGAVLPELSTEHDLWRIPVPCQTRICEC